MSPAKDPGWLRLLPHFIGRQLAGKQSLLAVISNSGWLLLDKMIRMLLGLFVGAWVARYLGPSEYGELAYVLAYLAFFQAVVNLGMDGLVVRNVAQNKNQAGVVLGTVFIFRLLAGFCCWAGAILVVALLNGWQDRLVILTALIGFVLIFQAADTIDLWFQSQSQSRRTVFAKLSVYLVSSGIKISLILLKAPLIAFGIATALDAILIAGALYVAYRGFTTPQQWSFLRSEGRKLVVESWPFILSGISIVVYMRIDQLMIKEMLGEHSLGIYAAVLPIATLWQFIPMTLTTSLAPYVARKKQESNEAYLAALSKIFRLYALLGWLISIPTIFFSGIVVSALFGERFSAGADVVAVYVLTNLFIGLGVAQSLWIINEGKSKISMYKTLIGAVVCTVGNFILIPKFGLIGVAIVAVISQFCSAVLANVLFAPSIFKLQLKALVVFRS